MSNPRDTPREQDRARTAVAGWRAANPGGTLDQMVAAIGPGFHKDVAAVLRGTWHLLAERGEREHQDAGVSVSTDAGDPAECAGAGGNPPANAAGGVDGLPARRAGDGGAVASVPPSPCDGNAR